MEMESTRVTYQAGILIVIEQSPCALDWIAVQMAMGDGDGDGDG
jgi:hypothetical protein